MATDTPVAGSNRPRPLLLLLLLLVGGFYLATRIFSGAPVVPSVSNRPGQRPGPAAANGQLDPKALDVRIESLEQKPPALAEGERNPFRFAPQPAPAPLPGAGGGSVPRQPVDPGPAGPTTPPPPPIPRIADTVKFIGVVETATGKIGAFSFWDAQLRECRGVPSPGREGDVIDGRYRVVRLGIESAVLEYIDGHGRETLPLNGQACVAK